MSDRMVAPIVTPRRDPMVTPSTSTHGGPGNRLLVLGCWHALRAVLSVGALSPSVWPHLIVFSEICRILSHIIVYCLQKLPLKIVIDHLMVMLRNSEVNYGSDIKN